MVRPKSSVIGFVDLGISALNAKKINQIDKSVGSLSANLYSSNLRIESDLEDIRKAQIASLYGIAELHSSLQKFDLTQNEILQELKRQDKEKDELGDLKIFMFINSFNTSNFLYKLKTKKLWAKISNIMKNSKISFLNNL